MADSLAGIALAAGEGRRLRPLTLVRPKPLCPVGNRPLVDWALEHLAVAVGPGSGRLAVNLHHGAEALAEHLDGRVQRSLEEGRALGTAGGVGLLAPWLDGRDALVMNADTWHDADLRAFVAGWDRERVRLLTTTPGPFGPGSTVVASLMPWRAVRRLVPEPSGLWEALWRHEVAAGRVDTVHHSGAFFDCGTPATYLAANLHVSGGASVVGEGAEVLGSLDRCVIWPDQRVAPGERLVCTIRADERVTVAVRVRS